MAGLMNSRRRIMMASPHIETASGAIANFKTDLAAPLKSCKINFSPVQEGSGDPSPDNVRAISGWTGVNLTRCGKNLFDLSNANILDRHIRNNSGVVVADNGNSFCQTPIRVASSAAFTLSGYTNKDSLAKRFYYLDENTNFIKRTSGWTTLPAHTEVTDQNCRYLQIQTERMEYDDWTTMQLEYGSSYSSYEPYKGMTINVDWQDIGELYGGYVDLVSGELVVDRATIVYDGSADEGWNKNDTYHYFVTPAISGALNANASPSNFKSNLFPYGNIANQTTNLGACLIWGTIRVRLTDMSISLDDWNDLLSETPMQIVYKLATPIRYSIDPITLKTLRGTNNIWSDANGDVEVTYWTH